MFHLWCVQGKGRARSSGAAGGSSTPEGCCRMGEGPSAFHCRGGSEGRWRSPAVPRSSAAGKAKGALQGARGRRQFTVPPGGGVAAQAAHPESPPGTPCPPPCRWKRSSQEQPPPQGAAACGAALLLCWGHRQEGSKFYSPQTLPAAKSSNSRPGKEQQCPDQEAAASPGLYLGHSCWVRPGAVLPPNASPTKHQHLQGSCCAPAVTAGDTAGWGAASSRTWPG